MAMWDTPYLGLIECKVDTSSLKDMDPTPRFASKYQVNYFHRLTCDTTTPRTYLPWGESKRE